MILFSPAIFCTWQKTYVFEGVFFCPADGSSADLFAPALFEIAADGDTSACDVAVFGFSSGIFITRKRRGIVSYLSNQTYGEQLMKDKIASY